MFDPKIVEAAVAALTAAGFVTVAKDVNGDLVISPAAKLTQLIEDRGVTLADIGERTA
jgi:hypothetical protein